MLKRFILYLSVFLVFLSGSAGAVVITHRLNSKNEIIQYPAGNEQQPSDPVVDGVFQKILSAKNVKASLSVDINNSESAAVRQGGVRISCDVNVNISDLSLRADINVASGGKEYSAAAVYSGGTLYAEYGELKILLEVSGIKEALPQLTAILSSVTGTDGALDALSVLDLESLDLTSLAAMLGQMTSAETEGGYVLTLPLDFAEIKIFADKQYNPVSIEIPAIEAAGYVVNAGIQTHISAEADEIAAPEKTEYLDATDSFALLSMLGGRLNEKKFLIDFSLNGLPQTVAGTLKLDAENGFAAEAEINYGALKLNAQYFGQKIFMSLNGVKIAADVEDIREIAEIFKESGDSEKADAVETVSEIKWDKLINSYISKIEKRGDSLAIALNGLGEVLLSPDESGKLSKLTFSGEKFGFAAEIKAVGEDFAVEIPGEDEYIAAEDFMAFIRSAKAVADVKKVAGSFSLNFDNIDVDGEFGIDFTAGAENLLAYADISAAGLNAKAIYRGKTAYIRAGGIALKIPADEIGVLIAEIQRIFGLNLTSDVSQSIGGVTLDDVASALSELLLGVSDGTLTVNVKGVEFAVHALENGFALCCGGLQITLTCADKIEVPEAEEKDYLHYSSALELIEEFYSEIESGKLEFNAEIVCGGKVYAADARIDFTEGLKAEAVAYINGEAVEIKYLDETVYVCWGGLKVKLAISEIPSLLSIFEGIIEIPEMPDLGGVTAEQIISKIDLSNISLTEEYLSITVNGAQIEYNRRLREITISYGEISGRITLEENREFEIKAEGEYAELSELKPLAENLVEIYKSGKAGGTAYVAAGNLELEIEFALEFDREFKQISAYARTSVYGHSAEIIIENGTAYADIAGFKVKLALNEIRSLVSEINRIFGTEIPENMSGSISDMLKNTLSLSEGKISAAIDGSEIKIYAEGKNIILEADSVVRAAISAGDSTVPKADQTAYADYMTLLEYAEDIYSEYVSGRLNASGEFTAGEKTFAFDIKVDFANGLKAEIDVVLGGETLTLIVADGRVYAEFLGIKAELGLNEIPEFINLFKDVADLPVLSASFDGIDWNKVISELRIENAEIGESLFSVTVNGIGVAYDRIAGRLSVSYQNFAAALNLNADKNFEIASDGEYISLAALKPLVEKALAVYSERKISGQIDIVVTNQTIPVDFILDLSDKCVKLYAETHLIGLDIKIWVTGTEVYIEADEFRVRANIGEIEALLAEISDMLGLGLDTAKIGDAVSQIEKILVLDFSGAGNGFDLDFVKGIIISQIPEGLSVSIKNFAFDIVDGQDYIGLSAFFGSDSLSAWFKADGAAVIPSLQPESFSGIDVLMNLFRAGYAEYSSKQYAFDLILDINGGLYSAQVKLDLTGGMLAEIHTVINVYDITVVMQENWLYIRINALKAKIAADSIAQFAAALTDLIGFDLSTLFDLINIDYSNVSEELLQQMMPQNGSQNVLFLDLIKAVSLAPDGALSVTVSGGQQIYLKADGGALADLRVTGVKIAGIGLELHYNAAGFDKINLIAEESKSEYMDLSSLAGLLETVKNTYNSTAEYKMSGKVSVLIGSWALTDMDLHVDLKLKNQNGEINPEIAILIDNMPLSNLVMADGNGSIFNRDKYRNRRCMLLYKEGRVYVRRTVEVKSGGSYSLKEEVKGYFEFSEFTSDLNVMVGYIQKIVGFSDTIKWAINQGIKNAQPPSDRSYEKYLKQDGYTYDAASGVYTLALDGTYVTNDVNVGDIKLTVYEKDALIEKIDANIYFLDNLINLQCKGLTLFPVFASQSIESEMQAALNSLAVGSVAGEYINHI